MRFLGNDALDPTKLPEWQERCLDKARLKQELDALKVIEAEVQKLRLRRRDDAASEARLARAELDLTRTLDDEIEKVSTFYLAKQGQLAERLWQLRAAIASPARVEEDTAAMCEAYQEVAGELGQLLDFARMNIDAVRKTLKKLDATVTGNPQLAVAYLQSRRISRFSQVAVLFDETGLKALVGGIRRGFEAVDDRFQGQKEKTTSLTSIQVRQIASRDVDILSRKLRRWEQAREKTERALINVRSDILLERSHIEREVWGDDDDNEDSGDEALSPGKKGWNPQRMEAIVAKYVEPPREGYSLGLWLNLIGTYLYLLNAFVAIPTLSQYTEYLGSDEALSGVILASLPLAAMIAALGLSKWTNVSFRSPLLFTVSLQLVGNLLYASAYPFDSFALIILGRFVKGLGAIRPINRRYISECVALNVRTVASAAFVAAGALGMASAPALSLVLHYLDMAPSKYVVVNPYTAPGWVMFGLWSVYLLVLWLAFEEPREYRHRSRVTVENHLLSKVKAEGLLARRSVSYGGVLDNRHPNTFPDLDLPPPHDADTAPTDKRRASSDGERLALLSSHSSPGPSTRKDPFSPHDEEEAVGRNGTGSLNGSQNERKPLQASSWRSVLEKVAEPRVSLCLWCYFLLKFVTEALFASSPIATRHAFTHWPHWGVGGLFTIVGLAVLPVNALLGHLSYVRGVQDRQMLVSILLLSAVCMLALLRTPWLLLLHSYTWLQYSLAVGALYCLMNALEGTIISLLSKVLAKRLAGTTFNAGLLGTEFASLGRLVGDLSVTVSGSVSKTALLDLIFAPALLALLITIGVTIRLYHALGY